MSTPQAPINLRFIGAEPDYYQQYREVWDEYLNSTLDEALIKAHFGSDLAFVTEGNWVYPSLNSICIAFETNLPAKSQVEYGHTLDYEWRTRLTDEPHFLHVHYLTGLMSETVYHYRITVTDEWGRELQSEDRVEITVSMGGKTVINALPGPPYVLAVNAAYYYLTADVHSDTRGISVACSNATIDLNGHTVYYDEGTPLVAENLVWNSYTSSNVSTYGVASAGYSNKSGCILVNGTIIQVGKHGTNPDTGLGRGFGPVYGGAFLTVQGITGDYAGISISGIAGMNSSGTTHHNVMTDRGCGPLNRSQGLPSIISLNSYNNLVRRTRHQGLKTGKVGGTWRHNEIHVDSWATNGFGILPYTTAGPPYGPETVDGNRVYCTGYHAVACRYSAESRFTDNFFCGVSVDPQARDDEYGAMSSVMGFRLTQYGGDTYPFCNNRWSGNLIIMKMGPNNDGDSDGAQTARGSEFMADQYLLNNVFEDNVVKAVMLPGAIDPDCYCIAAQGLQSRYLVQEPLYYRNNTFITNNHFVALGDSYGMGSNHRFVDNRYYYVPGNPDYHAIRVGYRTYPTMANRFIDEILNGVDLADHINVGYAADKEYLIGHRLYVIVLSGGVPLALANVTVTDSLGWTAPWTYATTTDAEGHAVIELLDIRYYNNAGKPTPLSASTVTGHTVKIAGYVDYVLSVEQVALRNSPDTPINLEVNQ